MSVELAAGRASSRLSGFGFALSAIVTLQAGNALGVHLIRLIDVPSAVALRLCVGAVLLVAVLRPSLAIVRDEPRLVAGFGIAVAVMCGSIYGALAHLPLAVATTIALLGPLTVAAIGSRHRYDLIWPALALVGVMTMAFGTNPGGHHISLIGVAFGLSNAVSWGAYIVLSARAGSRFEGIEALALAVLVAALIWAPIALIADGTGALTSSSTLLFGIFAGILATALPYVLENLALLRLPQYVFATLASLEPAVAAIFGLVLLDQTLTGAILAGMALVVVASVGTARASRRPSVVGG